MDIANIPLLGMLRERMSWLNARQETLSQNVANADAPGYLARDLKPLNFEDMMKKIDGGDSQTRLMTTDPHHINISNNQATQFAGEDAPDTEASMTGNTVSLEAEMIKVADTQAQYQAAANLYSKALSMMRTAIGSP
ncbi:MAG TPA: flagellar basal body rod protein FlgB [Rhizomicrobium sp.]|nr:flagellar basal body rod protein FlgB [Rhizomicrobium sp.]